MFEKYFSSQFYYLVEEAQRSSNTASLARKKNVQEKLLKRKVSKL